MNGGTVASEQIELPVRVGAIMFVIPYEWEESAIRTWEVTSWMISQNKQKKWVKRFRVCQRGNGKTIDRQRDFDFDDIGVEVFTSKEEAERG